MRTPQAPSSYEPETCGVSHTHFCGILGNYLTLGTGAHSDCRPVGIRTVAMVNKVALSIDAPQRSLARCVRPQDTSPAIRPHRICPRFPAVIRTVLHIDQSSTQQIPKRHLAACMGPQNPAVPLGINSQSARCPVAIPPILCVGKCKCFSIKIPEGHLSIRGVTPGHLHFSLRAGSQTHRTPPGIRAVQRELLHHSVRIDPPQCRLPAVVLPHKPYSAVWVRANQARCPSRERPVDVQDKLPLGIHIPNNRGAIQITPQNMCNPVRPGRHTDSGPSGIGAVIELTEAAINLHRPKTDRTVLSAPQNPCPRSRHRRWGRDRRP